MARALNRLNPKTLTAVKNPLPPGVHADGGGLYVEVDKPSADGQPGAKRFIVIYQFEGKRRQIGLGSINSITLERARELTREAREQVASGVDPKALREAAKVVPVPVEVVTFGSYALAVLETKKADWHGRKTEPRWLNSINNHCASILDRPVGEIDTADVLAVLQPIWLTTPEGAEKTRAVVETILDSAKARGLRTGDNPARWDKHLAALMSKRQKLSRGSHAALPHERIADLMVTLRGREGVGVVALELLILTGARTTEVREAPWAEFDLDAALWSIPRARVKERAAMERAQVTHKRIPLSDPAVALLRRLRAEAGAISPATYVFPGPDAGKPLGENGMASVLKRVGADDITVHGFRSTFRDWAGAQRIVMANGRKVPAYSFEACEISLGHAVGNSTTAAYFRSDLLEERRDLVADWGMVCAGEQPDYRAEPSEMAALLSFLAQEPQFAARWAAFQAGGGLAVAA